MKRGGERRRTEREKRVGGWVVVGRERGKRV